MSPLAKAESLIEATLIELEQLNDSYEKGTTEEDMLLDARESLNDALILIGDLRGSD